MLRLSLCLFAALAALPSAAHASSPSCRFQAASRSLVCGDSTYPCALLIEGPEDAYWCRNWTDDETPADTTSSFVLLIDAAQRLRWSSGDQYGAFARVNLVNGLFIVTMQYGRSITTWGVIDGRTVFTSYEREFSLDVTAPNTYPKIRTCTALWAYDGLRYRRVRVLRSMEQCGYGDEGEDD